MLISESYRLLNAQKHRDSQRYGTSGKHYAPLVRRIVDAAGTKDVLDYGCGKRTLEAELGFPIANYDPCIEGLNEPPEPHDIVVCTDVMEHIEPECLDAVLADLRRLAKKHAFVTIATGPANKTLADGRNVHLIQENEEWWLKKLWGAGFKLRQFSHMDLELLVTLR